MEMLEKNKFPDISSPFAWCASHGVSFWMTWNGHLQLCAFMDKPYIPYSGDLSADWQTLNDRLNILRNPRECEKCEWKSFCQRCPGALCAESGDPEKVDVGLCNVAKRLYDIYREKIKEEENRI